MTVYLSQKDAGRLPEAPRFELQHPNRTMPPTSMFNFKALAVEPARKRCTIHGDAVAAIGDKVEIMRISSWCLGNRNNPMLVRFALD